MNHSVVTVHEDGAVSSRHDLDGTQAAAVFLAATMQDSVVYAHHTQQIIRHGSSHYVRQNYYVRPEK